MSSIAEVRITVFDVNGNAPVLNPKDYEVFNTPLYISQGSKGVKLNVTDDDSGKNSDIEFKVFDHRFWVDKEGSIFIKVSFNAERDYHEFQVEVKDKGIPAKRRICKKADARSHVIQVPKIRKFLIGF